MTNPIVHYKDTDGTAYCKEYKATFFTSIRAEVTCRNCKILLIGIPTVNYGHLAQETVSAIKHLRTVYVYLHHDISLMSKEEIQQANTKAEDYIKLLQEEAVNKYKEETALKPQGKELRELGCKLLRQAWYFRVEAEEIMGILSPLLSKQCYSVNQGVKPPDKESRGDIATVSSPSMFGRRL